MLNYWIRPAAAALFWMILAGSTLAELGTLSASLHAAERPYSFSRGVYGSATSLTSSSSHSTAAP